MDVALALTSQAADAAASQAGIMMLRRTLDQQMESSAELLQALPPVQSPAESLEAHLGRSLDVYG